MKAIQFSDINIKGDLARRTGLNYTRLEGKWYRPEEVFYADKHGWPGDWEGRIILALTMLGQATHRTPAYLDEIIERIPEHLNEKGYFGKIFPDEQFDEQQMAGNSWALRSLIEYYTWKEDERVLSYIKSIVENLLLPARGFYRKYPTSVEDREDSKHWTLSKFQTKTKQHCATSDAGCAFIMLDGATLAYELLESPELKELIEEIIEQYLQVDFVSAQIQTHATLSGLRGVIRFYEITEDQKYLHEAVKMFRFYQDEAWTEAYGNSNWFNNPRWTEPCGIIDSFMIATQLWKLTSDQQFLIDGHLIYYNAFTHAQRENGSFGTDICSGFEKAPDHLFLNPVNYETYWCCTMRGGEGFSRAIEYNYFTDSDTLYVPYYAESDAVVRFDDGILKIQQKTEYPFEDAVIFKITEADTQSAKVVRFFVGNWSDAASVNIKINGKKVPANLENGFITVTHEFKNGDELILDLCIQYHVKPVKGKGKINGHHAFYYGPMILGYRQKAKVDHVEINEFSFEEEEIYAAIEPIELAENIELDRTGKREFTVKNTDYVLTPLCDITNLTKPNSCDQVLFKSTQ